MSRMFAAILIALLASSPVVATAGDENPSIPVRAKTNSEAWWNDYFATGLKRIKDMNGVIDVAVVGDSITARWAVPEIWKKNWGAYKAVNLGIGGDQTQHVLWRLQNGQLEGYKAKVFVLLIGTNNLWSNTADPAAVAQGIKAILTEIQAKQPQAKILLLGILPRGDKPNPGREKIKAVNAIIAKFAGGAVHYLDFGDKYLSPDQTISTEVMHDHLHLAPKGYDIWMDSIRPKLTEFLGEAKK